MSNITEFTPICESITATIHMDMDGGESVQGPVHVGFYPDQEELFIACEGHRINISFRHLDAVIKQLKRARQISANTPHQSGANQWLNH